MELFFTFLDGALLYDCPTCGSACCKGRGLMLDAEGEVMRFARLEPRLAALLRPAGSRFEVIDAADGCWMLQGDGRCAIETEHSYDAKPTTCKLFPFNRILEVGAVRVVDFNSKICPLQDAASARNGQRWQALEQQLVTTLPKTVRVPEPEGVPQEFWVGHEALVRDASALLLDEPDYARFAAFQEEAVLALFQGRPPPEPFAPEVSARTERMRALLARFRWLHGVEGDPGLAAAARAASRQVALLTSSWRFSLVLRPDPQPYPIEIQRLPRRLLAAAHLVELGLLGRRRPPGLRTATETFHGSAPLIGLLALFDRRAQLGSPIVQKGTPGELLPLLDKLTEALREGTLTLGEAATRALGDAPPPLRAMAFAALAYGEATLEFA